MTREADILAAEHELYLPPAEAVKDAFIQDYAAAYARGP